MRTVRAMGRTLAFFVAAALALAVAGIAGADGPSLSGSVGPGFEISLAGAGQLAPGPASLTVDDKSADHDFHLQGPGVDVTTGIDEIGVKSFSLNLVNGTYTFICDAHPTRMTGSFTVTTPATTPPATPPATTPPTTTPPTTTPPTTTPPETTPPVTTPAPPPAAPRLVLSVTAKAITLVTSGSGKAVKSLAAGRYVIVVHDRSTVQNAHLIGAGFNRSTGIAFAGNATWKATFTAGKLTYRSDAKKPKLRAGQVAIRNSAGA
jgi:hypothetical protein